MEHVKKIINQIKESEDRWKAWYMATWGESYRVKSKFYGTPYWNKLINHGLPASRNKGHWYTPENLHNILISRDGEIAMNHTITIFSLLEKLSRELCKKGKFKECSQNFSNRHNLVKFLKSSGFLTTEEEVKEFWLSGETRNCIIHNGNQVDEKWINAYQNARGECNHKIGDDLKFIATLEEVENWHDLFLRITSRIEQKLIHYSYQV